VRCLRRWWPAGAIGFEVPFGVADRHSKAAGFGAAYGPLTGLIAVAAAADDLLEPSLADSAMGHNTVTVVATQQQCSQLVDPTGLPGDKVTAGAEQDPQRFSLSVAAWNG
jgi:hypothetical protein